MTYGSISLRRQGPERACPLAGMRAGAALFFSGTHLEWEIGAVLTLALKANAHE